MKARLFLALGLTMASAAALAQDVLVLAGANDNPNALINGVFNGTTITYGTEVPTGGATSGAATSLAFNQTRIVSTAGCTLAALTNNTSNDVSIFSIGVGGTITPVTGSPFAVGAGAQSLAWAPDGGALYVPLAITGASQVITLTVSCTGGVATVTNAGAVTVAGFNLLRDAEVIGSGTGTHLCLSGTTSNNVGCTPIDAVTRLPATTTVNTIAVTNVRGMRIAPNGCGVAGVGSANTVNGFSVNAGGTVTATNTAATTTAPRYGAISRDGTLAAFGGFGSSFTLISVNASCSLTAVGSNAAGPTGSLVEYMAFDASNRLYVSDSLGNQIRVFAPTGAGIGAALATSTTNHATINAPGGIDVVVPPSLPDLIFANGFEL